MSDANSTKPRKRIHPNERIGCLVPIMRVPGKKNRLTGKKELPKWICKCDCGNERLMDQGNLVKRLYLRCTCSRALKTRAERESEIYWGMIKRTENKATPNYRLYGGRGIKVCDRWRNSFAAFLHDMGPCPSDAHSIDRIDTDGDYCPENCRWATRQEQGRNKRTNRRICFDGKTLCVAEWAELLGIPESRIRKRLNIGWTVEAALMTPPLSHSQCAKMATKGQFKRKAASRD